jgi:hypothetical protein
MKLANDSLATEVVSDSSDIFQPYEDLTPESEADTSSPDAPQDTGPEDRPYTNPGDAKIYGQRVRD